MKAKILNSAEDYGYYSIIDWAARKGLSEITIFHSLTISISKIKDEMNLTTYSGNVN